MNEKLLQVLWEHFTRYKRWLSGKRLSAHTKRAYTSRLNQFLVFLSTQDNDYDDVLKSAGTRDRAVADYSDYLQNQLEYSCTTINTTLSTLDHFFIYIGLGEPRVERAIVARGKPVVLTAREETRLLEALAESQSLRDRALVLLLLRAGLKVAECAALNVGDVILTAEQHTITICREKHCRKRTIVLDSETRAAIKSWIKRRNALFADTDEQALLLNRQGMRITTAGIDFILRKLGQTAGLAVSAEVLRHTCLMKMLAHGHDLQMVKKVSGHMRLETIRRYRPAERQK